MKLIYSIAVVLCFISRFAHNGDCQPIDLCLMEQTEANEKQLGITVVDDGANGFIVIIMRPGSYYVTHDLGTQDAGVAIIVEACDVSLDLRGCTITNHGDLPPLALASGVTRVTVCNGYLSGKNFELGVFLGRRCDRIVFKNVLITCPSVSTMLATVSDCIGDDDLWVTTQEDGAIIFRTTSASLPAIASTLDVIDGKISPILGVNANLAGVAAQVERVDSKIAALDFDCALTCNMQSTLDGLAALSTAVTGVNSGVSSANNSLQTVTSTLISVGRDTSKITAVESKVDASTERVQDVDAHVGVVESKLDALDFGCALTCNVQPVTSALGVIDSKVDSLYGAVGALGTDSASLMTELTSVNTNLEGVATQVEQMNDQMLVVESKIDVSASRVQDVDVHVGAVESKIGALDFDCTLTCNMQPMTSVLAVIDSKVDAVEEDTITLASNVAAVASALTTLTSTLEQTSDQTAVLDSKLDQTNIDLDLIESTLDAVEADLVEANLALVIIDSKVDALDFDCSLSCNMQSSLDAIDAAISTVNAQVIGHTLLIESKVDGVNSDVSTATNRIVSVAQDTSRVPFIESKVDRVNTNVNSVVTSVATLTTTLSAVGNDTSKITSIASKLDVVSLGVATNTSKLSVIETKLNTMDTTTAARLQRIESKVDQGLLGGGLF